MKRRDASMVTPDVPAAATLKQLSQALMNGSLDAEVLTEFYISRIKAAPESAVFIRTSFDRAYQQAAASARRYRAGTPLGPLDGIPVAWKDTFDVAGLPTTAGSALLCDRAPADKDAQVVANLLAAGMVTVGQLNMSEFAYSALGLNPHFGTPINPFSGTQARVPGGSSSGCGVAVARSMVPVAIGTDTGGSVRTPASFNGLVGYKPSKGRYSERGVFELSRTLDTIGVLSRSVEDCWAMDRALQGLEPAWFQHGDQDDAQRIEQIEIVVPTNLADSLTESAVALNFDAALGRLAGQGVKISIQEIPELDRVQTLSEQHGFIASADAYYAMRDLLEGPDADRITPFVYRRIMASKSMSAYDLLVLQRERVQLQNSLWHRLGDKILAMPTTLHVAPLLDEVEADIDRFADINARTIRNTLWGNMLNACGIAIPSGVDEGGMPTSVLLSAGPHQEIALLTACMRLEQYVRA